MMRTVVRHAAKASEHPQQHRARHSFSQPTVSLQFSQHLGPAQRTSWEKKKCHHSDLPPQPPNCSGSCTSRAGFTVPQATENPSLPLQNEGQIQAWCQPSNPRPCCVGIWVRPCFTKRRLENKADWVKWEGGGCFTVRLLFLQKSLHWVGRDLLFCPGFLLWHGEFASIIFLYAHATKLQ